MSYKTLIIVDNSSELTSYNQETIRQTLKKFITSISKEDSVAIAVTGETAQYITDYDDSLNTQLKTVDEIEFTDTNAPGVDVLMDVILSWKESDVACRDILYISCKDVTVGSDYTEEELLFEVNNKQYPIYTMACMQNDNLSFKKGVSVLSRVSGGICISTEDTTSDAEVDRQLADLLINAMRDKRSLEESDKTIIDTMTDEAKMEEEQEDDDEELLEENTSVTADEYYSDNVIYDTESGTAFYMANPQFVYPLLSVIAILGLFLIGAFIRQKKNIKEEERFIVKRRSEKKDDVINEPFTDAEECKTVYLSSNNEEPDTGTKLLYQTKEGIEITLEDRSNPTKFFRSCIRDSIVIGRNEKFCDVAITYDDSVSNRHCELSKRGDEIYCRDLGSSNGTMINQQKVYQEIRVESGDILRIGRLSFFVQIVGDTYE